MQQYCDKLVHDHYGALFNPVHPGSVFDITVLPHEPPTQRFLLRARGYCITALLRVLYGEVTSKLSWQPVFRTNWSVSYRSGLHMSSERLSLRHSPTVASYSNASRLMLSGIGKPTTTSADHYNSILPIFGALNHRSNRITLIHGSLNFQSSRAEDADRITSLSHPNRWKLNTHQWTFQTHEVTIQYEYLMFLTRIIDYL